MRVGIIGAGRVGCALATALEKNGADVITLQDRNIDYENKLENVLKNSDAIFLTVPDSQIELVSEQIVKFSNPKNIDGKVFLHCSGALTSNILKKITEVGGFTGSLHPIQTFPDRNNGWKGIFNIYFGFEGAEKAKESALETVNILNGKMIIIEADKKSLYHAAACVLSNYTVTISNLAENILENVGIPLELSMKAFGPLLKNTVNNIAEMGSVGALTGPISRGDICTLENHLEALTVMKPEIKEIYKILGEATVKLALMKGSIDDEKAKKMFDLFK